MVDELQASAEELRARQTEWTQQKARVDAVVDAAKADLQTTLVALAGELSDELGVDQAESRPQIDQRMTATLDQWAQRWDGELDLVLGEAGMQIDERLARPRAKRTEEFLRSITVGPTTIGDAATEQPGRQPPQRHQRRTPRRRPADIRALHRQIARPAPRRKPARRSAAKTAARLAKAKDASAKATRRPCLDASLQIADAVMTVVTIIDAERRQHELDAERRRQREEARDRIERNAAIATIDIVDGTGGEPGWRRRSRRRATDAPGTARPHRQRHRH